MVVVRLRRGDGVDGAVTSTATDELRRVVQATARVCDVLRRARPPMRSALYRPWCFSFGYELPWSDPRCGFRTSNCCGISVLRTLVMPLLSLWLSRCQALPMMAEVSGKMIKKTPPLQSQDSVWGGPGSNEILAPAAFLSDPLWL